MGWACSTLWGEERRGAYGDSMGKPEGNSSLGRSRLRWEDNIKMGVLDVGWVHGLD
jgi:hypothetical protein